jgi:hypothetical protein
LGVAVELDLLVDVGFYFRGQWPNALMDAISENADEIYKSLAPNPLEPDMLVAERTFRVDEYDYRVTFGVEKWRALQNVIRVLQVRRLTPNKKR